MELLNETPFPAVLIRGIIDEEQMFGSLVARITYALQPGGHCTIADEQVWEVSPGPWKGPAGDMPGDELFYRGGVDVFVFGSARAPQGRPVTQLDVGVEIGPRFRYRLNVFGDRFWDRRLGQLTQTPPMPFHEIPLSLSHAFGGADEWDELAVPFPDNPEGKGFCLDADSALGKPLPNIENPLQLVRSWSDRPEPVGMGVPPYPFGPRLQRSVEFDASTGMLSRLDPTFFNHAFPSMVAPKGIEPGDRVDVWGTRFEGDLTFILPQTLLQVELEIGERCLSVQPPIDQIGIEPDQMRCFVTYRFPFRYRLIPLQKRRCTLRATR